MTWVEKYRPKLLSGVEGQESAIAKIKEFLENFKKSNKKAIVLQGPPGVGKTTLAIAAANGENYEIFELNASDFRSKEKLEQVLRPALEQQSLSKKGKIILLDEVDGISGTDRGGIPELLRLVDITTYPIIMTANDIWDQKFSDVRKKCELISLEEISYKITKDILIKILRNEKKFLSNDILTSIAIKSKGDLRAAINDIQTLADAEEPTMEMVDERNKEISIFNALKRIKLTTGEIEISFDDTKDKNFPDLCSAITAMWENLRTLQLICGYFQLHQFKRLFEIMVPKKPPSDFARKLRAELPPTLSPLFQQQLPFEYGNVVIDCICPQKA